MKGLITFVQNFLANKGSYIALASIFSKIALFVNSVLIIKWIAPKEYGVIAYAVTIFSFLIPFVGMGSYQGLLRFAPLMKTDDEKIKLSNYTLTIGFFNTLLVCFALIAIAPLVATKFPEAKIMIMLLGFRLLGLFFFEQLITYFKVLENYKTYAFVEMISSASTLFFSLGLAKFYGANGYFLALLIAPFFTVLVAYFCFQPKIKIKWNFDFPFGLKSFWEFAIITGFTSSISTLILLLDVFFVGNLISKNTAQAVALYKVATLIPLNLLFLPQMFMKTDFADIAKNAKNKAFLRNYYFNFAKFFTLFGGVLILGSFLFGDFIIPTIFGKTYTQTNVFKILIVGTVFSMCLRTPLGNILSALGKARINSLIVFFTIFCDIILNVTFIQYFGLVGAAYATTISMAISGLLSLFVFLRYLKKLPA